MAVEVAQVPTMEDDDLPPLPPNEVTFDAAKGLKTVIAYSYNDDDELVREIQHYRIEKRMVSHKVAQRKMWRKFGDAKDDPPGPNSTNTFPGDSVTLQLIQSKQPEQDQERVEEDALKAKSRAPMLSCRFCKGTHFSHQCPNKSDMEAIQDLQNRLHGNAESTEETAKDAPERLAPGSRYLPPPLRGGGGGSSTLPLSGMSEKRRFEGYTVRVTNLPFEMTADDLKQIFSKFGRVTRIYPAKDKVTQQNRGFAFISYSTQEEASAAIYIGNGLRHSHVVLKVDWAKPSAAS